MLIKDILSDMIDHVVKKSESIPNFKTGFSDLDRILGGFLPGDFVVIASRPGIGKTAISQSIIANQLDLSGKCPSILVISLDVSKEMYTRRLLSTISKKIYSEIWHGPMEVHDLAVLNDTSMKLSESPINVLDSSHISIDEVRRTAKGIKEQHGLDIIIIDSLQRFRFEKQNSHDNSQLDDFIFDLKLLAEELSVPIVALAPVNRKLETRQDHRPNLADIKGTDMLEEVADKILLLYRDEVYYHDSESKGIIEVIIAKNKYGPLGGVSLVFDQKQCRVSDFEVVSTITESDDPFNVKPYNIFALFDNNDLRKELEELSWVENHEITFSKSNCNRINKKDYRIFIIDRNKMGTKEYKQWVIESKGMKNCATIFIDNLNKTTMPFHDLVLIVNPDTNQFIDSITYMVSKIARYYTHINSV
jgi:KaiC/GvpD/RAD55 family RecA-like ATPase